MSLHALIIGQLLLFILLFTFEACGMVLWHAGSHSDMKLRKEVWSQYTMNSLNCVKELEIVFTSWLPCLLNVSLLCHFKLCWKILFSAFK